MSLATLKTKVEQLIDYSSLIKKTKSISFAGETALELIGIYLYNPFASLYRAFYQTTNLKRIKGLNTSAVTDIREMFRYSGIVTIDEPFDLSSVSNATNQNQAFTDCNNLVDVRFVSETIKFTIRFSSNMLSSESTESIISGLANVTTAQNLILQSGINLTEEQKATIQNKGWTLVVRE